ncbi:MAG: hypothetical protein ACJ72D_12740 [Marmoricola sp.]
MDDPSTTGPDRFTRVAVPPRWRNPVLALGLVLLSVVVTWLFGHLPWVLDGFRTDRSVPSTDGLAGVRIVIPMVAGQLSALVAFTVVGAVSATLLPMLFTDLPRGAAVTLSVIVVAATTLVLTLVARARIEGSAAPGFATDSRVLDGLVVGVFAVAALGALLGALASLQLGFLPVAVAVVVVELPTWFTALGVERSWIRDVTELVLLAAALVLSLRRSPAWAALWPAALLVVWSGPAVSAGLLTVQTRLRSGQNVDALLGDVLSDGFAVFRAAYWHAPRTWWPPVVALVVGVVWLVVRLRRSRPSG